MTTQIPWGTTEQNLKKQELLPYVARYPLLYAHQNLFTYIILKFIITHS